MKRSSVYVVLVPERTWDGRVSEVKVDRLLREVPKLRNTEVAVRLHLDVDERIFEQFLPEVTVAVTGERQLIVPEAEIEEQDGVPLGTLASRVGSFGDAGPQVSVDDGDEEP